MTSLTHYLIAGLLLGAAACAEPQAEPAQTRPENTPVDYELGETTLTILCVSCHSNRLIERSSGYTRPQWKSLIATMTDLSGAPEVETATLDYLAANYPPNDNRLSLIHI